MIFSLERGIVQHGCKLGVTTLHSSCNGATGGYCWYNDPDMDAKIEAARSATDSKTRAEPLQGNSTYGP